jgi:fatty acid desaturase
MPMSTDVRLPRDKVPVFPDACCACGAAKPGDTVEWKGRRVRLAELLFPWLWFFGKRAVVKVPVCAACRPRVLATRRWLAVLLVVAIGLAMAFVFPLAKSFGFGRKTTKVIVLAMVVVVLLPYFLWSVLHPPAFDITVGKDHVDYEFASREYALRFRDANAASVLRVL